MHKEMIRIDQKITKIEFRNLEFSIHPSCTQTLFVITNKFCCVFFLNINAINRKCKYCNSHQMEIFLNIDNNFY